MIRFKRGKASSWQSKGIILADGQPGYAKDTNELKIGDGTSSWDDLPSIGGASIILPSSNIDDYIVAHGTTGIWTYQIWRSGIAKCWGTYTLQAALSTAFAETGLYHNNNEMSAISYPFSFRDIPVELVTIQSENDITWLANKNKNTSISTGVYTLISPELRTAVANYNISFFVEGLITQVDYQDKVN